MLIQGNAGIGFDDLFQLYCFPDHFIAISPLGEKWAMKYAPWIRKTYIPYGVDLTQFKFARPMSLVLKKPIVFCVAAFSPYKRIDLLIKAMAEVPEASLLVIGNGDLEQELRVLGGKLLGNRFLLKTGIAHEKLSAYYKSADLFSLPSASSEAFGIVYIEAMAAGLPVVAPNDYNRREIIGEAGMFVDPKDSMAYASAIKEAIGTDFGDKPRLQAEKFSWKKIIEKYKDVLIGLK